MRRIYNTTNLLILTSFVWLSSDVEGWVAANVCSWIAIGGGISISYADSGSSSLVTSRADFWVTMAI